MKLCGIIATLNKTCELIKEAPDCDNTNDLSDDFKNYVNEHLVQNRNYINEFSLLDVQTVKMASILGAYFNSNKIIIAEYNFMNDNQNTLNEWVTEYLTNKTNERNKGKSLTSLVNCVELSSKEKTIMKKILLHNGHVITATDFCQKTRTSAEEVLNGFRKLEVFF